MFASDGFGSRITKFGANFHVRNAEPADSGRWSCERSSFPAYVNDVAGSSVGAGFASTNVMQTDVIVSQVGKLVVFVRGEIINSSVIHLRRDYSVDIVCAILSSGDKKVGLEWSSPASVGWLPMTHTKDIYHYDVATPALHNSPHISSLVKVSSWDVINNNYDQISCHSRHNNHDNRVTLKIVQEYRPEFTISRSPGFGVPILEDMRVTLKCIVESNPACEPVWEHNGVGVDSNSVVSSTVSATSNTVEITFDKISPMDEGWYICTTVHKFGNFSSVGYYLGVKPQAVTSSGAVTTASLISDQVLWIDSGDDGGGGGTSGGAGQTDGAQGCSGNQNSKDFSMPVITPEQKTIR